MRSHLFLIMGLLLLSHSTFGATQDIPFRALTPSAPMVGGLGSLSPQYLQGTPLQSAALQRTAPSTSDNTLESRMADLAKAVGNLAFALTQLMPDPVAQNNGSGKAGLPPISLDVATSAASSMRSILLSAFQYSVSNHIYEKQILQQAINIVGTIMRTHGKVGIENITDQLYNDIRFAPPLIRLQDGSFQQFNEDKLNNYLTYILSQYLSSIGR